MWTWQQTRTQLNSRNFCHFYIAQGFTSQMNNLIPRFATKVPKSLIQEYKIDIFKVYSLIKQYKTSQIKKMCSARPNRAFSCFSSLKHYKTDTSPHCYSF